MWTGVLLGVQSFASKLFNITLLQIKLRAAGGSAQLRDGSAVCCVLEATLILH